ncbi:MAG: LON peptidase substrate-binding domain-containing protein, partial [Clostridia bacterium]|nr:LON peptidase substrate-binding domain-containing protein [Clostridia bacterium]
MATYPVIPLRGLVVFPHTSITIDMGRKKSIAAYNNAVLHDNLVLFCTQKDLTVAEPTESDLNRVGTVCRVMQRIELPNNNIRLLVQGLKRVRIANFLPNENFFEAEATELEILNSDTVVSEVLFRQARELLATLSANSAGKINKEVLTQLADKKDVNEFIDLLAHLIVYYDTKKQEILEMVDTEQRIRELCVILSNEIEIAKVNKKIAKDVKDSIDKGQKEFYLKEQMKAISHELGTDGDEIQEIENKIKASNMPKEVQDKALKELARLAKMPLSSPDASVSRTYLEWLTDLEWHKQTEDNKD